MEKTRRYHCNEIIGTDAEPKTAMPIQKSNQELWRMKRRVHMLHVFDVNGVMVNAVVSYMSALMLTP